MVEQCPSIMYIILGADAKRTWSYFICPSYIDIVPYFPKLTKNTFESPNANMATFHSS